MTAQAGYSRTYFSHRRPILQLCIHTTRDWPGLDGESSMNQINDCFSFSSDKETWACFYKFSQVDRLSTQIDCRNLFALMAELAADDEPGVMILVSLFPSE